MKCVIARCVVQEYFTFGCHRLIYECCEVEDILNSTLEVPEGSEAKVRFLLVYLK